MYSLRSDYQFVDGQQSGYLRKLLFSPADNQIHVTTYSPNQTKNLTDSGNQFNLPYAMDGTSDFALIGSVTVPSGSDASVAWPGLAGTTQYEWYAVSDNGGAAATSSTWNFTTQVSTTYNISMLTGWNLVSFPWHPGSTAIANVLTSVSGKYDLVYAWDATGGHSSAGNWMRYAPGLPGNIHPFRPALCRGRSLRLA